VVPDGSLVLSRQVELGPKQNYLCLALMRLTDVPAGEIAVRVDGKSIALLKVPERDSWTSPVPRYVSLKKYRGQSVKIEVEHQPAREGGAVDWRALELVETPELVAWKPLEAVQVKASAGGPSSARKKTRQRWKEKAVKVDDKLPVEWVVVTRDLCADFGEFTLTGLGLNAFDGSPALFNNIRLGLTMQDFEER
jgi:hypothetical protein